MKWRLALSLLCAFLPAWGLAETIHLRDGSVVRGAIKRTDSEVIEVETREGTLLLKRDRVIRIDIAEDAAGDTGPAARRPEPRRLRFYGEIETWFPTNVSDGATADVEDAGKKLKAKGFTNSTQTSSGGAGIGGRIGFRAPIPWDSEWGLSLGYVAGPSIEYGITVPGSYTLSFPVTKVPDSTATARRSLRYIRLLGEARRDLRLNEHWALELGAGLGVANGRATEACTGASGALAGVCSGAVSASWTGVAWEIAPAVNYRGLRFGPRLAGFPKFNGDSDLAEISWLTYGFFLGYVL